MFCSFLCLCELITVYLCIFQKGKVTITASPGVKLEIPDGAVLENKVRRPASVFSSDFILFPGQLSVVHESY